MSKEIDVKVLLKTYDDLEKQYKSLMKQVIKQDKRIDKAIKEIKIILEMARDYEEVNLVDRLEIILKTLRGKDNE